MNNSLKLLSGSRDLTRNYMDCKHDICTSRGACSRHKCSRCKPLTITPSGMLIPMSTYISDSYELLSLCSNDSSTKLVLNSFTNTTSFKRTNFTSPHHSERIISIHPLLTLYPPKPHPPSTSRTHSPLPSPHHKNLPPSKDPPPQSAAAVPVWPHTVSHKNLARKRDKTVRHKGRIVAPLRQCKLPPRSSDSA